MRQLNQLFAYWKEDKPGMTAVLCCLGMSAGLFFSRALLSFFMLVMLLNALRPSIIRQSWQSWRRNPFALLSCAFFLVYLLSGLWSDNKAFWLAGTINKIPFVVLPFAFLAVPLSAPRYQRIIITGLALMQLMVILYSLTQFALHTDYYLKGYGLSRPLPTTRYDDHIRFSLSLVLSVLMFCYLLFEPEQNTLPSWLRIFLIADMILFILYIHILAAKTGIACLYLAAIVYILLRLGRNHRLLALLMALGVICLPVIAYKSVPTFKTKMDYVFYEVTKSIHEQRFDYTLSDAGRMITYELGLKAISDHPVWGVGAGDVMDEMRAGYRRNYPEVSSDQQYGPINQFLFSALGVGIPLSLFLVAMVAAPFFMRGGHRIYLGITSLAMLLSLMVEAMLELQFGVFTYLFFTLFWISSSAKNKGPFFTKPVTLCPSVEKE